MDYKLVFGPQETGNRVDSVRGTVARPEPVGLSQACTQPPVPTR